MRCSISSTIARAERVVCLIAYLPRGLIGCSLIQQMCASSSRAEVG